MRFEFATTGRIIFGPGTVSELPTLARKLGRRALLVIGSMGPHGKEVEAELAAQDIEVSRFVVSGEPVTAVVQEGVEAARTARCDVIIGLGGGSAIDTGKAIAALLTNGGQPLDYLEVVGRGQPLTKPSAPYIAVPTTAGTGAEVTRNAVLGVPEQNVKVSMRSAFMLPDAAIVDPQLTHSMPPAVTASTGLDALTQVMEPFVSHLANPLTDGFCREGLRRAARSLLHAYTHPDDAVAREDMALASLMGGLALANAKLGAVHGFAGPLGGMYDAPHGVICARLLPFVMQTNVEALRERAPFSQALLRYDEVARLVTGDMEATAVDGVRWVQALCAELDVPPLGHFGITPADFPAIVEKSRAASSMKGNPIELTHEELTQILRQAV